MDTLQGEPLAVPTLALRHRAHTSLRDSLAMLNPVKVTALTVAPRHQAHTNPRDSPTTANLVKATALTVVRHLRILHRSRAPTTRLVEANHMDNNPTVDHRKADMEDSTKDLTVDLLSSTVAMIKAATAALAVLQVTISNRAATANLKADMADMADSRLLMEATEVVDTSSSMATVDSEDDSFVAHFLGIET